MFFAALDAHGRLTALSESLESHLGYEPRHLSGSRATRVFPEEDLDWLAENLDSEKSPYVSYRGRVIHIDGRVEPIDLMATLLCGPFGPCGIVIHATDQIPATQVDERLERNQRRFRALIHNAPVVISVVGPDGFWVESSDAGTRMLGYPKGFDPEGGLFSLVHDDDLQIAHRALEELLSGTRSPNEPVEFRVRAADGEWHTFESFGQNLLHDDAVGGVVVWSHDVSERKRAEEMLRASEERFRKLAEAATEGVSLVEGDRVIDANSSFAKMYGYEPHEVIGLPVSALIPPELNEEILSSIDNREAATRKYWGVRKDGSRILVAATGRTVSVRGRVLRVTTHTDLTEQLQIVALHERRRLARDLHDGLAHELALMAAKTTSLLREQPGSQVVEELASASERALDEARRAISVLSRADAEPLEVGIEQTVEDVAARHGVSCEIELEPTVDLSPDAYEQLLRIVREAITNAARHGGATHVRVRLWDDDGAHLVIEDDGCGFDATVVEDRGFGLVSMQERTSSVGGKFNLSSTPGLGTTIEVVVPRKVGPG